MESKKTPVQILEAYNHLNPAEKKVADYILSNEEDVIHLSITELATRSQVSETTIIRFCRRLGYEGYQDFKIRMAQEMVPLLSNIHKDLAEDDSSLAVVRKVFASNIKDIEDTLSVLDPEVFEKAIHLLVHSSQIVFIGEGGSANVARDAEHKFIRVGIPTHAYTDPLMQLAFASLMKPGETMIGISHSGSSKNIVRALKKAREGGANTICITRYNKSPITEVADVILSVYSNGFEFRNETMGGSRIAQLCIIDSLYVEVAHRFREKTIDCINKIRKASSVLRY